MGFTKLDERILMSSIMAETPEIFKVWIAILASCKEDGVAYVSSVGLSSHCYLPLDTVREAITKLSSPDPDSRSINDDGRRIKRVDGGYMVINYLKYRELSTRDREAQRKYEYRRKKKCPGHNGTIQDYSASPSASASPSVVLGKEEGMGEEKGSVTLHNVTPEEKVFEYWNSKNNLIHHRELTESMEGIIKDKLKEIPFDDMVKCIDNYNTVIGSPDSWYSYKNSIDDFFRPGKKKLAPCMKFVPERYVESNFIRPSKEKQEGGIAWKE